MSKLNTARWLMAITILLIIVFQGYWIKKLYQEENNNFKKSADLTFRETMYRLQAERFTGDTMVFKGLPGDNFFMADIISSVQKVRVQSDSAKQKLVISMNTETSSEQEEMIKKQLSKDTIIYVDTKEGKETPPHIERFLEHNPLLNDTIPVKRIDSLYKALLAKEGIEVAYRIVRSGVPQTTTLKNGNIKQIFIKSDHPDSVKFSTKRVPVGFLSPLFYKAEFESATPHIFKKLSLQLLLSLMLIALTITSFVFIYRSLLAQKRLTAIKNEFIGNITHELKTPISTVSVAIEAMKNFNALQNPERTQEYLGIAGQELNRLSLLVDKVLRLSMFETQQVELKYEWFDIKNLLDEVSSSMQLQFEKFGAETTLELNGNDFNIMADRMHISSVLYNLLDNALKYSRGKPKIDLSISATHNEITLVVKDNGIGIPASYQDKIFDKFFRVPHGNEHNVKGYGLGLSYVSHIIGKHKGSIKMQSEEGSGTTFIIKLPKENAGS